MTKYNTPYSYPKDTPFYSLEKELLNFISQGNTTHLYITMPRGCGKTTFLKAMSNKYQISYVNELLGIDTINMLSNKDKNVYQTCLVDEGRPSRPWRLEELLTRYSDYRKFFILSSEQEK